MKGSHLIATTAVHGAAVVAAMGWDRLILALAVIASVVALTIADRISGEATIGILSAIVGYVVGAGHQAAKTDEPVNTEG